MGTENRSQAEIAHDEKQKQLYLRQRELLDTLLLHCAITQQQHDKSLRDLTEKMGVGGD